MSGTGRPMGDAARAQPTLAKIRFVARGAPREDEALHSEGARVIGVCNACRYCEGFCAVFPAMERRTQFGRAELDYLANLCHQCGACFYACQYAPPHAFAVNVPRTLAQLRTQTYAAYAWPRPFSRLYRQHGSVVALALAAGLALFLLFALALGGARGLLAAHSGAGSFYAVFPHGLMVALFGAAFGFALLAMAIGGARFWRAVSGSAAPPALAATRDTLGKALTLRYLDGGGDGCYVGEGFDDRPTHARRVLHHLMFYGFALCFASTTAATLYHYVFDWQAPYAFASLPVLLGTIGGLGLVIGPAGLLWLKHGQDARLRDPAQKPLDNGLLWLLLLASVTGLALLGLRETASMPMLLATHLGCVLALFVTLPYGKFVHGLYRYLALAKYEREARQPNPVQFSDV